MPVHEIDPVYDQDSRILILGSFPSVASRETRFFYGHPRNRFWKVLSALFHETEPETVEEKKKLLLAHHVAVWDVIANCEIKGSADASIRNIEANDLERILKKTKIERIFTNGSTAYRLYRKHQEKHTGIEAIPLPSTSPANASHSLERLIEEWKIIL